MNLLAVSMGIDWETALILLGSLIVGVGAMVFAYYASSNIKTKSNSVCKVFKHEIDLLFRYITDGSHTVQLRLAKNPEDLRMMLNQILYEFQMSHEDAGVVSAISVLKDKIMPCLLKRLVREGFVRFQKDVIKGSPV